MIKKITPIRKFRSKFIVINCPFHTTKKTPIIASVIPSIFNLVTGFFKRNIVKITKNILFIFPNKEPMAAVVRSIPQTKVMLLTPNAKTPTMHKIMKSFLFISLIKCNSLRAHKKISVISAANATLKKASNVEFNSTKINFPNVATSPNKAALKIK